MRLAGLLAVVLVAALVVSPALAQVPTKGLSKSALGPRSWLMQGSAARVNPDKKQLVMTTEKGNVALHVPEGSDIFNKDNKKISLNDIKEGDRVLAAFHWKDGQNEVTYLYKPRRRARAPGPQPRRMPPS
jgi:Cu/Ag efflux protein CusF